MGYARLLLYVVLIFSTILLPVPARAESRLALIITNATYPADIGSLANPHKDGALIAGALQSVGFERDNIVIIKDADQPAMRIAFAEFVERIDKAGPDAVVFFYYSGHGAADRTERGENYVVPVGAKITLAKQLPILGVSLSEITKSLERVPAKARFVVVDACRDVAFTKGLKEAAKGFVPERKLDGMILAFATRPGETAEDNNIYASALASILPTPGLEAEQVFKETQRRVADLSKGRQIPWTEDGLLTRFKFKDAMPQPDIELAFWNTAKASGSIAALQSYLQSYPKGPNSAAAKLLIEKIRQEEASRAALQKKAEEEALAKSQQEERIAAERREAEERARREAEAKRQAAAETAKKKSEKEALAKRQQEEQIAAEKRAAEEHARQEAEAKRQAAAEAAKKKAEEETLAKRQQEVRIAAEHREAEERARRDAEAIRQAAAEAAKKKAEEKSSIVVAALPPGAEASATANRAEEIAAEQAKLVRSLKTELKRVGCDPGEVDGVWGDNAKAALVEFARVAKVALPGDAPNPKALQAVLGQKGRICRKVAKVISKSTRRVEDQVQMGSATRSATKLKCGYHGNFSGGSQKKWGAGVGLNSTTNTYSCD
jgi:hypothetical protein